jgi:hypothetical protein
LSSKSKVRSAGVSGVFFFASISTLFVLPGAFDPVNYPKLAIYVLIAFYCLPYVFNLVRSLKFGINSLESTLLLFLLTFLVSVALGPSNLERSLIGSYGRGNGFLAYLTLSLVVLLLINSPFKASQKSFITSFSITSLLMILYGFLQVTGNDFLKWNFVNIGGASVIATLGNPNFASVFYSFATVFFLYLAFESNRARVPINGIRWGIFFYLLLSVASFFLVYRVGSVQGFVLVLFGVVVMSYVKFKKILKLRKSLLIALLTLLGSLSVTLAAIGFGLLPQFSRFSVDTLVFRLGYWKIATRMILDNPILGVGTDSLGDNYRIYRNIDDMRINQSLLDNAHNIPIQIAATSGAIVSLALIVAWILISLSAFRNLRGATHIDFSVIVSILWFMYLLQSVISIEQLGISIWGWISGAVSVAFDRNNVKTKELIDRLSEAKANKREMLIDFVARISLLAAFPFVLVFLSYNISFNNLIKEANTFQESNSISVSPERFKQIFNFFEFEPTYSRLIAASALRTEQLELGEVLSQKAVDNFPNSYEINELRATVLEVTQRAAEATNYREKNVLLEPRKSQSWFDLSSNYELVGRKLDARQSLISGISKVIDPDVLETRLKSIGASLKVGDVVVHNLFGVGFVVDATREVVSVDFEGEIGIQSFDTDNAPLTLRNKA